MEKLFISCPMRGRSDAEIKATMEQMHRIAEAVFDTEFEVIPTYIEEDAPECASQCLWYLGESIKKMQERELQKNLWLFLFRRYRYGRQMAHLEGL